MTIAKLKWFVTLALATGVLIANYGAGAKADYYYGDEDPEPPIQTRSCPRHLYFPHLIQHYQRALSVSPEAARTQAILVWGGDSADGADRVYNRRDYWSDVSYWYMTLRNHGVPAENIQVLMGRGAPHTTLPLRYTGFGDHSGEAPSDLDCDGRVDVTGPATLGAVEQAIEHVKRNVRAGDQMFFIATGHGGRPFSLFQRRESTIGLHGEARLFESMLDEWLGRLPRGVRQALLLAPCYSGNFQEIARRDRCVITASRPGEEARGGGNVSHTHGDVVGDTYGLLLAPLANAINRVDPDGRPVRHSRDENGDGFISLAEAFPEADFEHHPVNEPRMSSLFTLDSELSRRRVLTLSARMFGLRGSEPGPSPRGRMADLEGLDHGSGRPFNIRDLPELMKLKLEENLATCRAIRL